MTAQSAPPFPSNSHLPLIIMDTYEISVMEQYLSRTLQVLKRNMVSQGVGDYYWDAGLRHSLEHKSGSQLIQEAGERLDRQLVKHSQNADRVGLVVSNIITPSPQHECIVWERYLEHKSSATKTWRWRIQQTVDMDYKAIQAYVWRLQELGISVSFFPDLDSMATGISSFVYNSHKPESKHHTLLKHLRPDVRVSQKVRDFHANKYVETLMGVRDGRVGEVRALELINRFGTPFNVYVADYNDLVEVLGVSTAQTFLRAIGRNP